MVALPAAKSDTALVVALRAGREEARGALFDRHGDDMGRVLYRILRPNPEIPDLLKDVFAAALSTIHELRQPEALRGC